MSELSYLAPTNLAEALVLLAARDAGTRLLAGGTDLIVQMRSGRAQPQRVVDLKKIPELSGITADGQGFVVGAATPCAVIGEHAALRAAWPGVVEAARLIGSTQVQGRATLGGNICNASPAADSVPALIAAGALAILANGSARRELPIEKLMLGPAARH